MGVAAPLANVRWRAVYGVGWLGGIGFTMALFIADLAFADAVLLDSAKIGILGGSLVAGIVGWSLLRFLPLKRPSRGVLEFPSNGRASGK